MPGHDARLGPLLQPGAGQGRDDDRDVRRLQPRPGPVRGAHRPASLARRHDRAARGGPDRRPGAVAEGRPAGDPRRARRDRRPSPRPRSGPALSRTAARSPPRSSRSSAQPDPSSPTVAFDGAALAAGDRLGGAGRDPWRRRLRPVSASSVVPAGRSSRRRASPAIAGTAGRPARGRRGRRGRDRAGRPARSGRRDRGRERLAPTDADAGRDPPDHAQPARPRRRPSPPRRPRPRRRRRSRPATSVACANRSSASRAASAPASTSRPGSSPRSASGSATAGRRPLPNRDIIGLGRDTGALTFASDPDAVYPSGDPVAAPTSAGRLIDAFVSTDGVAASRPQDGRVDKRKATFVDLTPAGDERVGLFGTANQTFYLEAHRDDPGHRRRGQGQHPGDRHRAGRVDDARGRAARREPGHRQPALPLARRRPGSGRAARPRRSPTRVRFWCP